MDFVPIISLNRPCVDFSEKTRSLFELLISIFPMPPIIFEKLEETDSITPLVEYLVHLR